MYLSQKDVSLLESKFQIGYTEFVKAYCRWVEWGEGERLSLKEKANFDCIFWDMGCTVYQSRPLQCRTYPFWESIVSSRQAWEAAAKDCQGIGFGNLHCKEEIDGCLAQRDMEPVITRPYAGGRI